MKLLLQNILYLGFRNGYRYWRLQMQAIKHPERVLQWADAAEEEARRLQDTDMRFSDLLFSWADELRKHHADWKMIQDAKKKP